MRSGAISFDENQTLNETRGLGLSPCRGVELAARGGLKRGQELHASIVRPRTSLTFTGAKTCLMNYQVLWQRGII